MKTRNTSITAINPSAKSKHLVNGGALLHLNTPERIASTVEGNKIHRRQAIALSSLNAKPLNWGVAKDGGNSNEVS